MTQVAQTQSTATQTQRGRPADPESKAQRAVAIFDEMNAKGAARKDIIARFVTDLSLTKAGAATYHQNIKKAKGLVKTAEVAKSE